MTVDTFQRVVKTLGDSTRLRLLALLERQELSVADLVKLLDLPQSTVSRHLAHLKEQGLLSPEKRFPGNFGGAAASPENIQKNYSCGKKIVARF